VNLEKELDRLYGLSPAEFTSARETLAKKLRAEGDGADAARVKTLRKPTAAAGIVNRLARDERMNVRALLAAGERLRDAQASLLRGSGPPDAVHKAADDERNAIAALLKAARKDAPGDAVLRRVEETLRAAAVDEEARHLLEQGRLTRELEPVGFGLAGVPIPIKPRRRKPPAPDPGVRKRREELVRAKAELEAARSRAREAARELARAEEQVRRLERSSR
jgi:hypothetical protein